MMPDATNSTNDFVAIAAESMERGREAIEDYFQFLQKTFPVAAPWWNHEFRTTMARYAQENIRNSLACVQKLGQARGLAEVVQIQSDFFQIQMKALMQRTHDLTKAATNSTASPSKRGE